MKSKLKKEYLNILEEISNVIPTEENVDMLSEGVQKQNAVTSTLIDTRIQLDIKMLVETLTVALKPFDIKVVLQPVQKNTRYQVLLFARKSHNL